MYRSPLNSKSYITSDFNHHIQTNRNGGIDLVYKFDGVEPSQWARMSEGKPLISVCNGEVKAVQNDYNNFRQLHRQGEKWVFIQDLENPEFSFLYLHNKRNDVMVGDRVSIGDPIGLLGYTGYTVPNNANGSHLHFEVRRKGVRVDPEQYIDSNSFVDPDTAKVKTYEVYNYKVQSGDTLGQIAENTIGYSRMDELIRLNNIKNPDFIRVGDILKIPIK